MANFCLAYFEGKLLENVTNQVNNMFIPTIQRYVDFSKKLKSTNDKLLEDKNKLKDILDGLNIS